MSKFRRLWQRIIWEKTLRIAAIEAPAPRAENSLRDAVQRFGSPSGPGHRSRKRRCCFRSRPRSSMPYWLSIATRRCRWDPAAGRIRDIAIQEMCRLVSVQNLLLFAGPCTVTDDEYEGPVDPAGEGG